jgi:hypothetical protein
LEEDRGSLDMDQRGGDLNAAAIQTGHLVHGVRGNSSRTSLPPPTASSHGPRHHGDAAYGDAFLVAAGTSSWPSSRDSEALNWLPMATLFAGGVLGGQIGLDQGGRVILLVNIGL